MIKIWGRNTSSNVQKAMWAVGELGLECERIDVGGAFGKNKEPAYLAMNPNGLVPTLEEEDGFLLWESNSIVRYLAGKHDKAGVLEPKDAKARARRQSMDGLAVVGGGAGDLARLLGPDPHAGGKARPCRDQGLRRTRPPPPCRSWTRSLPKTKFLAGDAFSYGDIPVGVMCYRYIQLVPERPSTPHLDRWYAAVSARKAFQEHVGSIPLS